MLRRMFGAAAPLRGEVVELLHHELTSDTDFYQAKVRLDNGREVEMVMQGDTYPPGTRISAVLDAPWTGNAERFPSKTGAPVLFVKDTQSHEKKRGRIATLAERFLRTFDTNQHGSLNPDRRAIDPATEQREKLREEGVEYGKRFVECADLTAYNNG